MSRLLEGLRAEWCRFTHGGGHVQRDPLGRVNWQCNRCGRWSEPVPAQAERALVDADVMRAMRDRRHRE